MYSSRTREEIVENLAKSNKTVRVYTRASHYSTRLGRCYDNNNVTREAMKYLKHPFSKNRTVLGRVFLKMNDKYNINTLPRNVRVTAATYSFTCARALPTKPATRLLTTVPTRRIRRNGVPD